MMSVGGWVGEVLEVVYPDPLLTFDSFSFILVDCVCKCGLVGYWEKDCVQRLSSMVPSPAGEEGPPGQRRALV